MTLRPLLAGALILGLLGGCDMDGRTLGAIGGAAAGAGLGKAAGGGTLGIILGAAAGAWLGGEIGKSLDERDRHAMHTTTQAALDSSPAGTTSRWSNPQSGNSGTVTPQQSFTNAEGAECREFQQTVSAGGKTETGYATACRQPDGSWKVVG
ncbi:MAG: RT0821/Lpp0805 family surface protein [Pseudomonadota bacterium]